MGTRVEQRACAEDGRKTLQPDWLQSEDSFGEIVEQVCFDSGEICTRKNQVKVAVMCTHSDTDERILCLQQKCCAYLLALLYT